MHSMLSIVHAKMYRCFSRNNTWHFLNAVCVLPISYCPFVSLSALLKNIKSHACMWFIRINSINAWLFLASLQTNRNYKKLYTSKIVRVKIAQAHHHHYHQSEHSTANEIESTLRRQYVCTICILDFANANTRTFDTNKNYKRIEQRWPQK